jgi:hypothetical protein
MGGLCFLLAGLPLCAQVRQTYVSKGKTIGYTVMVFDPPAQVTAENGPMNQDNALNCLRLFWSRLSSLDMAGAAQVHTDPQSAFDARMKYKERVGEQVFRQMHAGIFAGGERFPYELAIGKSHALVGRKGPGTLLLFVERDGKFWIDNTKSEQRSPQANDLIALVNAYGDGKLKFQ